MSNPETNSSLRQTLITSLVIIAVIGFVWFLPVLLRGRFDAGRKPALDTRNPETIDLIIRSEPVATITNLEPLIIRSEPVATITNTAPLMSLLRTGKHVHSHQCIFQGFLCFHYSNGDSNCVYILPGHTKANYEFVCSNGYFALPRTAFMTTLAQAGVDTNRIPTK